MSDNVEPISILTPVFSSEKFKHILPSPYKADGMVFAVAACPEIPMPEQWMPWLIQQSSDILVDKDVNVLADALMNNLRAHLRCMRDERAALPRACVFNENTQLPATVAQWLEGLLYAHQQLENVWQQAWQKFCEDSKIEQGQELPEKRLSRCLKLFSTLANVELAMQSRNALQAQQLKENLPMLWKQLPAILNDYVCLAGQLASALPNQFETFTKAP